MPESSTPGSTEGQELSIRPEVQDDKRVTAEADEQWEKTTSGWIHDFLGDDDVLAEKASLALVEACSPIITRQLIRLNPQQPVAVVEDLRQEVLKKMFNKLGTFRGGSFKGWIYTMTRRLYLDALKRVANVVSLKSFSVSKDDFWNDLLVDGGIRPDEAAAISIDHALIRDCMEKFKQEDPQGYKLLEQHYFAGVPEKMLAYRLKTTVAVIKEQLEQSMSRFKSILEAAVNVAAIRPIAS